MKAAFVAAAAAILTGGAAASHVQHRHAHDLFKAGKRANDTSVCVPGCTTVYSTITGPAGRTWNHERFDGMVLCLTIR